MDTNCIAMVVPYNWDDDQLPSKTQVDSKIVWKKQVRHASENVCTNIVTDTKGNIYIIGYTEGVLGDISPAPSISPLDPRDKDVFVIKFNSSGEEIFKVQIGSLNEDRGLVLIQMQMTIYVLVDL